MKITKAQLKQIIKEELEVTLTNEEAGEMFGESVKEQLDEQQLNEDLATLMQNLTPENLQLVAQAIIKVGTTFGVPMLAAALGKIGIEAFQAARTAKNAEKYINMGEGDRLVDFLYNELTDYKGFRGADEESP